jgi:hypothetical protein
LIKILSLILLSLSLNIQAAPERLEFIFLSESQATALLHKIDKPIEHYSSLAENEEEEYDCTPMGDGCFHPQLGYIEKKPSKVKKKKVEPFKLNTINSTEVNMVDCKKGNYFDIFCGKAQKGMNASAKMEVWFDISSSMRKMDYSKKTDYCERRSLATRVLDGCPKDVVSLSVFNTSIKQVGELSTVCLSHGTNNQKRLMDWIKRSKSKYLLVVTDIDELTTELRDFINKQGAKVYGTDIKDFTSPDLSKFSKNLIKTCKKL